MYKVSVKILIAVLLLSSVVHAQNNAPQLLKKPADWQFERFSLPPEFAADFPYHGAEELRFSPGMFNKSSNEYFTYAFVAELDNTTGFSQNDVQDYLTRYFKGLCSSTARKRNLVIDVSKISVQVMKNKTAPKNETIYDSVLNIFGVFADGAPVKLNMEIQLLPDAKTKKMYLFFIASPNEKTDAVWKNLYEIRKDFIASRG
ncbi:MAG: hypothetical protein JST96_01805 [Bacteroidetes bacterium]|nr:hypothetical protein [Bacteroidota bacterium]